MSMVCQDGSIALQDSVRLHEELLRETQDTVGDGPTATFLASAIQYCKGHFKTIQQHGRFPHRDGILGRS